MKQSNRNFFLKFIRSTRNALNSSILFFLLFCTSNGYGQQHINSIPEKSKSNNPYLHELQIEKFFLHTNKSIYFPGEKIWFKAYVVNDVDDKPSLNTTNLHLNLYNIDKKLINHQLLLAHNGMAHGQIKLSDELPSGKYYIELTTQWNQNFSNNSSVTQFDILNNTSLNNQVEAYKESKSVVNPTDIDDDVTIQFFPESGNLLEGIVNMISFKASASVTGKIIEDKTGIIVAKFKSNEFDMGKFKLYMRPDNTYSALIFNDGKQIQVPLPKTNLNGIIISKSKIQNNEDSISFTLKTNEATMGSIESKYFYAVLHRNGSANAVAPIKFKKNYINYSFNILNSNLFNGVNTVTLFNNQNKPISEYSFFYADSKKLQLEVSKIAEQTDSITLNINGLNINTSANLSISILPFESKLYHDNISIKSAFLLAPYLESANSILNNYFNSENYIDNINLLIQTNSKKNNLINQTDSNYNTDNLTAPENGMTISGNVDSKKDLTNFKVMLSSVENGILLIESVGKNNAFSFNNLFLRHPTEYKLALLDPDGEIVKTEFRMSQEIINYKPSEFLEKSINNSTKTTYLNNEINYSSLPLLQNMTLLDEAQVTAKKKRVDKWEENEVKRNLYENHMSQSYMINDDDFGITIYDYLQRIPGIKVVGRPFDFKIFSTRGAKSFTGLGTMAIIYDGMIMQDNEVLMGRTIDEFAAVSVNQLGAMLGSLGQNGYVSFYTRNANPSSKITPNLNLVKSETEFGFDTANKYQNELMTFTNEISKKHYGTIDWIPNFEVNPNALNQLKFHSGGHDNFKVIINGMSADGNFAYDVVNITSTLNK